MLWGTSFYASILKNSLIEIPLIHLQFHTRCYLIDYIKLHSNKTMGLSYTYDDYTVSGYFFC